MVSQQAWGGRSEAYSAICGGGTMADFAALHPPYTRYVRINQRQACRRARLARAWGWPGGV
jgi:muramidase (phage lysozyme)